mgnify:CR=1 FL=1
MFGWLADPSSPVAESNTAKSRSDICLPYFLWEGALDYAVCCGPWSALAFGATSFAALTCAAGNSLLGDHETHFFDADVIRCWLHIGRISYRDGGAASYLDLNDRQYAFQERDPVFPKIQSFMILRLFK